MKENVVAASIVIVAASLFLYVSGTIQSVLLFIPALLVSYFLAFYHNAKGSEPSHNLLFWYLIALAIQLLHFGEEYSMDFVTALPALLNQDPYSLEYWTIFNMVAYAVFIIGAIVLLRNIRSMMVIPYFFIVAGVFLNGVGHILLSVWSGSYFPGLVTGILYLFLFPAFIKAMK